MNKNEFWKKLSEQSKEKVKKMDINKNGNNDYEIKSVVFGLYSNWALNCKGIDNVEEYLKIVSPDDFIQKIYEMQELGEIKLSESK